MQITFKSLIASYDPTLDTLIVRVARVFDEPTDSEELFKIVLDFTSHSNFIESSADEYVEMSTTYPSEILFAFVKAFTEAYAAIDGTCSPLDAFAARLVFTFDAL